jgi:hypothetical protein
MVAHEIAIVVHTAAYTVAADLGLEDPKAVLDGMAVALATAASANNLDAAGVEELCRIVRGVKDKFDRKPAGLHLVH